MKVEQTRGNEVALQLSAIWKMARSLDRSNPDDIAQDVAMKLLKLRPEELHFSRAGWLRAVVQNAILDRRRKMCRESRWISRNFEVNQSGMVCETATGEEFEAVSVLDVPVYEDEPLIENLRQAIASLPLDKRNALALLVAGYSYTSIAEMTGASVGTVRSRIYYARRHVRSFIE